MDMSDPHQAEIIDPWKAYIADSEWVKLEDALMRQSSGTIRIYPPGIPLVMAGSTFTETVIKNLEDALNVKSCVVGMKLDNEQLVEVVCGSGRSQRLEQFSIKTFLAKNILEATAIEIADFFGAGFSSWPYHHFAFQEDDPFTPLPPSLDFKKWDQVVRMHDIESMDVLKEQLIENAKKIAKKWYTNEELNEVSLPQGFNRWTDPTICRSLILARLEDPGYITLVRDNATGKLCGLLHARMGTVKKIYYTEEWRDPFIFSRFNGSSLLENPERFYRKIRFHFNLTPNDEVMTISAQLLNPSAYGGEIYYAMMKSMAECVSPQHAKKPLICEIPPEGTAHTLNVAATQKIVFDVIQNQHPVVYSEKTSDALFYFLTNKPHWTHALKAELQGLKHFKKKGYIPSTKDHRNVVVKPNGDMGLAVYATAPIQRGERIAVFEGEAYEAEDALSLSPIMRNHAIQVGPKTYVFGYQGLAHMLCHSCEPNCGVRDYTEIFAVRDIAIGGQLTWDYRCSENSNWVLHDCLCGSLRCSKTIRNYDSLPHKIKTEYGFKGMVSDWIINSV